MTNAGLDALERDAKRLIGAKIIGASHDGIHPYLVCMLPNDTAAIVWILDGTEDAGPGTLQIDN